MRRFTACRLCRFSFAPYARLRWERWKGRGYTVRVYVPYGPEWRAYSTRRLRKNPAIAGHVLRAMISGK